MIEDIVKSDLKTILHSKRANLYYLVEAGNAEETEEPPFTVTDDEIERITYVA